MVMVQSNKKQVQPLHHFLTDKKELPKNTTWYIMSKYPEITPTEVATERSHSHSLQRQFFT